MTCPVLPTADFVVLKPDTTPQRSTIILIERQEGAPQGDIVAVGPWVEDLPLGARVVVRRFAETRVQVGEEEWWLVNADDVLCRLA